MAKIWIVFIEMINVHNSDDFQTKTQENVC